MFIVIVVVVVVVIRERERELRKIQREIRIKLILQGRSISG